MYDALSSSLENKKALKLMLQGFFSTEGRDRTGTSVTSSVFETDASTDSATSAWFGVLTRTGVHRVKRGCKNTEKFIHRKPLVKKIYFLPCPLEENPYFCSPKCKAFDMVKRGGLPSQTRSVQRS